MTSVSIVETPGGDQPLPKAEGHVTGYETQLAEATAYVSDAEARLVRIEAENAERLANAQTNVERSRVEVDRLTAAVQEAKDAVPAAREAQAAYDALPQDEKDRQEEAKRLDRLRADADAATAAYAAAQAATEEGA